MDALCCVACSVACSVYDFSAESFLSLLCSRATPQTKNNSKNAEVIAMLSACNVSTIVVWLRSIEPIMEEVVKPKELTSTNHAHKRMQRFGSWAIGSWGRYLGLGTQA